MREKLEALSSEALKKRLKEIKEEMKRREVTEVSSKYEQFKTIIEEILKASAEPLT